MPISPTQARDWQLALFSIYYYGRRGAIPAAMTFGVLRPLNLQAAAASLLGSHAPEAKHPIRLALTDLCRTRAAGQDVAVDTQIERLATELAVLENVVGSEQQAFVKFFTTDLFQHAPTQTQVYLDAVKYLAARFQPSNRVGVSLVSYEEGLL